MIFLTLIGLLGCHPTTSIEALQAPPSPFAIKGRMYLTLKAPTLGVSGTTTAFTVFHRPEQFYLQIMAPVGGQMLSATANSSELTVSLPSKGLFLEGDNPEQALKAFTNDVIGVDGLMALFLGKLPQSINFTETTDGLRADTEFGALKVELDKRQRLRLLEATSKDGALLTVKYDGWFKISREYYPEIIEITLPTISLKADFQDWEIMGSVPEIFSQQPPKGITPKSFEEALRDLKGDNL